MKRSEMILKGANKLCATNVDNMTADEIAEMFLDEFEQAGMLPPMIQKDCLNATVGVMEWEPE